MLLTEMTEDCFQKSIISWKVQSNESPGNGCHSLSLEREREQTNFTFNEFLQVMDDLCWGLDYDLQYLWDEPESADLVVNCEQPQLLSSLSVWTLKEWY